MLEDANKRLVDMQQQQLIVNQALLETLAKLAENNSQAPTISASDELEKMVNLRLSQAVPSGTNMGHDSPRPKTATEKVQEYLAANPSAHHETVRDLAEKIGVGKSTVNRVLNGKD